MKQLNLCIVKLSPLKQQQGKVSPFSSFNCETLMGFVMHLNCAMSMVRLRGGEIFLIAMAI